MDCESSFQYTDPVFLHICIVSQKSAHLLVKCLLKYDVYFFVTYRIYKNCLKWDPCSMHNSQCMQQTYTSVNRFKPNVPTGFRTHPSTYSVGIEGCFLGIKWKACEADHLPLNSLKVKNKWSSSFIPCMPPWNAQKQFYLYLFTLWGVCRTACWSSCKASVIFVPYWKDACFSEGCRTDRNFNWIWSYICLHGSSTKCP